MTSRFAFTIVGLAMLCVWPAAGQQPSDIEVLFQAALHKEQVELKLDQAIAGYSDVVAKAGGNRAIAAKALLQMAGCYERLGKPEARTTYARIVSEYATSGAVADAARTKLAAMDQKASGAVATKVQETDPLEFVQPDKVSRDGGYMSFMDNHNDIGLIDLSSGRRRMLTSEARTTESWGGLSVPSPDGRLVAYDWWDGKSEAWELRVVDRDGGAPKVLTKESASGRNTPVGWSPNSKSILTWRGNSTLVSVPVDGSEVKVIKEFARNGVNNIGVSPDGRFIAFSRATTADKPERDLFSLSLETGRESLTVRHEADDYLLGWLPNSNGQILFASDRGGSYGIWTVRVLDGVAQGDPMLVRRDADKITGYGFTRQGDFYFGTGIARRDASIATLDQTTGRIIGNLAAVEGRYNGGMVGAAWSPTGDRLAYIQVMNPTSAMGPRGFPQNADERLAIQTMSTGDVRLWPHGQREGVPTWTPDGLSVIVPQNRTGGGQELVTVNVETGARTTIGADPESLGGNRWGHVLAPDGRNVFFQLRQALPFAKNPAVVVRRDLTTGVEQTVMPEALTYFNLTLSADGKWLAILRTDNPAGESPITIIPSSGGERRTLATALNEWSVTSVLAWSPDGRSVYAIKAKRDAPYEIWQVPLDGGAPRYTGISSLHQFNRISVHPDGRRLVISQAGNTSEIWVLKNIPVLREK